jgi:hypothetical protein
MIAKLTAQIRSNSSLEIIYIVFRIPSMALDVEYKYAFADSGKACRKPNKKTSP